VFVCTHIYTRWARANVNVAQSFASLAPRSPPSRRSSGSNGFFRRYHFFDLRIIIVHYPNAFRSHRPVRIGQNDDDQVAAITNFVYLIPTIAAHQNTLQVRLGKNGSTSMVWYYNNYILLMLWNCYVYWFSRLFGTDDACLLCVIMHINFVLFYWLTQCRTRRKLMMPRQSRSSRPLWKKGVMCRLIP